MTIWQEIQAFTTLEDYDAFEHKLEDIVKSGEIDEVPVDVNYGDGEVYGGRWFINRATQHVWRLVPPDFPFRGLWEPVYENCQDGPRL